jgi:hypothetical protein
MFGYNKNLFLAHYQYNMHLFKKIYTALYVLLSPIGRPTK